MFRLSNKRLKYALRRKKIISFLRSIEKPRFSDYFNTGERKNYEAKQFNIKTNISQMKTRLISYGMLLKGLLKISSSKEG